MPTDAQRPACTRADATAVVRRLRDAGHVAYFAGGCVRDLLLGREPKDYDVATDAPPQRVRQLFHNTQAVGAAFGVILVRLGGSVVEVATFRTDGTYTDGRRPDTVTFATAEEDARRRDFTINGLFMDPLDGDRVIDFVGGRADLDAKLIRAIGNPDERFAEDHLRLLRAVRFAARLGFTIEPATADAIRRHAGELPRISPERIADELRRMPLRSTAEHEPSGYRLIYEYRLAPVLFRFMPGGPPSPYMDPLTWTGIQTAKSFGAALATVALGCQWDSGGRPDDVRSWLTRPAVDRAVQAMRRMLSISNDELAVMTGTLLGLGGLLADPEPTVAQLKRFLRTPTSRSARDLASALKFWRLHEARIDHIETKLRDWSPADCCPPPLVTGDDLTAAGAVPGPAFKRALDAAYDAQLEDRVTDKAAALALAMGVIASPKAS
jgi:poly(A) polymerase